MKSLDDSHIIRLYDAKEINNSLYMIMELADTDL